MKLFVEVLWHASMIALAWFLAGIAFWGLHGCATEKPVLSYNFMHCTTVEDDEKGHVGLCWIDQGTEI